MLLCVLRLAVTRRCKMAQKDVFQPFLDVSSLRVTSGLEFLCRKLPARPRTGTCVIFFSCMSLMSLPKDALLIAGSSFSQ